eukprot:TRINITY_DN27230_c0_g2_i1.p1 TRINITY_DN27230_c0_g2~~TRINITY_DN27230_c0_g2_i1.p1  ORF type:complete len:247 (+),score=72.68 TRINITY_DN27230_c0_g2_i1:223-963(+)
MGAHGSVAESPLASYLEAEFARVAKHPARQVLHLHQVQQLKPPEDCPIDLRHLPTLWRLYSLHEGGMTYRELLDFAEFCNERRRILGSLDFHLKLKAQCDVDLFEVVAKDRGEEAFADWVILLVSQGEPHMSFECSPGVPFLSRDAVMTLWELMVPYQISAHVDQQGFLDMLQQIAERLELMALNDEILDDWVPVEVVHRWVQRYIAAFANLYQTLNLGPGGGNGASAGASGGGSTPAAAGARSEA